MIKISVTRKGRFDADCILGNAMAKLESDIKNKLRLVRCPVHNQAPTVKLAPPKHISIGACCQTLLDAANVRLRR